jgi:predicted ribosomally synthesized peptide with SipW-like signal peptide
MKSTETGRMSTKVALTLGVLALFGLISGFATWAAFSDTTVNSGNTFTAGTVDIDDDDADTALYAAVTNGKPASTDNGCTKVTFNGTLDSTVKLYSGSTLNSNGLTDTADDNLTLTITSGTGSINPAGSCTGFSTSNSTGNVYNGSLGDFVATYPNYTSGLGLSTDDAVWSSGETVSYKFEVTLADDNDANAGAADTSSTSGPAGFATGSHAFTWEARNN